MARYGNQLVREARRRAGLTQRELAVKAGTTQSAIARLETGRSTPTVDSVLRLVRLCGLDVEFWLVERDESDWAQARRRLRMAPEELMDRNSRTVRTMTEMRRDVARQLGGTR